MPLAGNARVRLLDRRAWIEREGQRILDNMFGTNARQLENMNTRVDSFREIVKSFRLESHGFSGNMPHHLADCSRDDSAYA